MADSTDENASMTSLQQNIVANLESVRSRLQSACSQADRSPDSVRLVAVSKTQPIEALLAAYDHGSQRVFGENYVQELVDKVQHFQIKLGNDQDAITWHFIGALQSNKVNLLVSAFADISQLVVETVSSEKLANKLNTAAEQNANETSNKLKVFIQVNTSGETSKSGIGADHASIIDLCRHVSQNCPHLELQGLMTIGAPGDDSAFDNLRSCRDAVEQELSLESGSLELSMGMSGDFETAIAKGSTNVRVGSTIFGARDYSNKK